MVSCKVRDAGKVWKSKVQVIRCGAKVRVMCKVRGAGRRSTLLVVRQVGYRIVPTMGEFDYC